MQRNDEVVHSIFLLLLSVVFFKQIYIYMTRHNRSIERKFFAYLRNRCQYRRSHICTKQTQDPKKKITTIYVIKINEIERKYKMRASRVPTDDSNVI